MAIKTLLAAALIALLPLAAPGADEKEKKGGAAEEPRDARQTVAAYIDAALNGRVEEAMAMGEPGKVTSQRGGVEQWAELKLKKLALKSVRADDTGALAITEDVTDDRGRTGPLVIELVKKEDAWLVRDIDLETEATAKDELKRFLNRHPDAVDVPEKEADKEEETEKAKKNEKNEKADSGEGSGSR